MELRTNLTNRLRTPSILWPITLAASFAASSSGCAATGTNAKSAVSAEGPSQAEPSHSKYHHTRPATDSDWWPNRLDLRVLKTNSPKGDPLDASFDYASAFAKVDLPALKQDIEKALTTSQNWWPADYGHYGALMIRLAWHSSGTYRVTDGRGGAGSGTIRFAPLNSWPDNANLDKARRLLWPLKQKYGRNLSWADLIVLSGTVALESMGFETFGFGGGREDVYEATDINWGPETTWLADKRFSKDGKELNRPLGAVQMGLIYVNPEGPHGNSDPLDGARHIRLAFGRMAMNDEETVALIAGGHTLGKAHGAAKASECLGPEPEAAPLEEQGLGWKNRCGSGRAGDTITSGLEGAWTYSPVKWSHDFFSNLFKYEWELTESPGGARQWVPKGDTGREVPDAHDPSKGHKPIMLTTDLALRVDPIYSAISRRFLDDPKQFEAAFARAWFKLTHRDMGPHARLVGADVPEPQLWQDPVPPVTHKLVNAADVKALKAKVLATGLTVPRLTKLAWASASTYRDTDKRGGANGARVRLAPQKDWASNESVGLSSSLPVLEKLRSAFNGSQKGGKAISMADLIVLAGDAAIEQAAKLGGHEIKIPFTPGRSDATQETTDINSFANLEPHADGFTNYYATGNDRTPAEMLVDRADLLSLSVAEMTVLLGGLRVLGANHGSTQHGQFTSRVGTLSNDFFVNLLELGNDWQRSATNENVYEIKDSQSGQVKWTGTAVDLVFGSNSQLRAVSEVYAGDDAKVKFVDDFASVWTKVMSLDRFDTKK